MKVLLLSFFLTQLAFAHDISLKYAADVKDEDKKTIEKAMEEVSGLLPKKLKSQLPLNIEVKVTQLSNHSVIPNEVCSPLKVDTQKTANAARPFIYGEYNQYKNVLTINTPVLIELKKGAEKSTRITCQHKSLYEQSIATIVHELTHAYDFNNGRISNSMEYIRRAGFKKGLLKVKNKNLQAMRSADLYELVNIAESFAVNMEYFTMDPEFMCRKPSMFDYFSRLLEVDPFPNRNCKISSTVMVSTQQDGYVPVQLDSSRVYRIDYLLASAGKDMMSGFGHSMFRIVMCAPEHLDQLTNKMIPATPFGKKCLEDKFYHLIVSYRANVEDSKLSYMKGVFGGYPSLLYILPFADVLEEYNRDELRDLISYPLTLSSKEREDFIARVREEHWNYRGSYKFINNNCAVESYDLLKAALNRSQLNTKSSVSPNGVLEDLDQLQFLSMSDKNAEVFPSKSEQIILAYSKAYGYKLKNLKADKAAVQKFIANSTIDERMDRFSKFSKTKIPNSDLNAELTLLKDRVVMASSFSVIEQQVLRTLGLQYRKQAGEMLLDSKDEKVKAIAAATGKAFLQPFSSFSKQGYGIPLDEEVVTMQELTDKRSSSINILKDANQMLLELMPKEFAIIDKIAGNIQVYNQSALAVRKEYREKLEIYVRQVIKNLSREDFTRSILVQAENGDGEALVKVRELLGKDLITNKEMLDSKLQKLISEVI